jgi:hypothetical protein
VREKQPEKIFEERDERETREREREKNTLSLKKK